MTFPRPDIRYPLHDVTDSNSAVLPTSYEFAGFTTGLADPTAVNALLRSTGAWVGHLDCTTLRNVDWLYDGVTPIATRLTSDQFAYPLASGLGPHSPTTQPVYHYSGSRLEVNFQLTQPDPLIHPGSANTDPIIFAPSKVTWIYMSKDGNVTLDVQPVATAAAPPAGTFALVGVTTDGSNIVSLDYTGTPDYELNVDGITMRFTKPVFFDDVIAFTDDVTLGDDAGDIVTVLGTATFTPLVTFLGGIQNAGATAVNLVGGATIAASKSIIGNATTSITSGQITSLALIESVNGFQGIAGIPADLPLGAIIPTGNDLDLEGTASIVGTATSTITAGTFDTIDAGGVVNVGEVAFYSDSTPSTTTGVMQFNGRAPTIGQGSVARHFSVPVDDWVAGDITTANPIDDTGADVTLTLEIGEKVMVEMKSEMTNDNVAPLFNMRIEANGTTIGGTVTRQCAAPGVFTEGNRSVEFTAVAAIAYQFKARYGALAGTTTARNILITARRKD